MYKAATRALLRHSVAKLNDGDYRLMLKMASPDFALSFPGDNSWATMFRPTEAGREQFVTHRGIEEGTAFAKRFVTEGIQFHIEDILVNGPPWNTRIALRVQSFRPSTGTGPDEYNNRAIAFMTIRWGRLLSWEDYEDTERVRRWDDSRGDAA